MTEQELREKIKDHIDAIATIAAKQGYYSDEESDGTTDAIMGLIKPKELVWDESGIDTECGTFQIFRTSGMNGQNLFGVSKCGVTIGHLYGND